MLGGIVEYFVYMYIYIFIYFRLLREKLDRERRKKNRRFICTSSGNVCHFSLSLDIILPFAIFFLLSSESRIKRKYKDFRQNDFSHRITNRKKICSTLLTPPFIFSKQFNINFAIVFSGSCSFFTLKHYFSFVALLLFYLLFSKSKFKKK